MSTKEKTKIYSNREYYKKILKYQNEINDEQNKIDELKQKLNEIENKKNESESQQEIKTTLKNEKDAEIKRKQEKLVKTQDEEICKQLENEISKLQDERMIIIKQIVKVKNEIGTCESKKEMYQGMLKRAENWKQRLNENFEALGNGKKEIIDDLNEIYQITN